MEKATPRKDQIVKFELPKVKVCRSLVFKNLENTSVYFLAGDLIAILLQMKFAVR